MSRSYRRNTDESQPSSPLVRETYFRRQRRDSARKQTPTQREKELEKAQQREY